MTDDTTDTPAEEPEGAPSGSTEQATDAVAADVPPAASAAGSSAAGTGAAETGAAETSAAETGAAETGAAETGPGEVAAAPDAAGAGAGAPALPDWLTPIADLATKAIAGDEPAGCKLYDQADYEELDAEIKKPQAMKPEPVDWGRVDRLAKSLLESTSKDLKVAGYLAVAATERVGAKGHAVAATLLATLAADYGAALWPRRKRARAGALEWMGERLVGHLDSFKGRQNELDAMTIAANSAKAAFETLKVAFAEDEIDELRQLRKWADGLDGKRREAERASASASKDEAKPSAGGAAGGGAALPSIESPADARAALTEMRKALQKASSVLRGADPTDAAAYRANRFAQWPDSVAFAVGPDGETPIPMLDQAAADAQLEKFESERDEGVLGRIEALFAERPFWFDLQRVLAQTMQAFGARFDRARAAIEGATVEFLGRESALVEATFASGVPLCSTVTRAWLDGLTSSDAGGAQASSAGDVSEAALAIEAAAREAAARGDLRGALQAFQDGLQSQTDPKTKFRLRLGLAQVCVGQGHASIALPHLSELRTDLGRLTVGEWAPELAIDVLAATVEACRKEAKARGKNSDFAEQAAEALSQLSRLDPLRALELGDKG